MVCRFPAKADARARDYYLAVAPSQRGGHQGQHLVSCVRPPRRISEANVAVDEFTQTRALGEGHRKEQPSIGD